MLFELIGEDKGVKASEPRVGNEKLRLLVFISSTMFNFLGLSFLVLLPTVGAATVER